MEACLIDIAKNTFRYVIVDTSPVTPDVVVDTIRLFNQNDKYSKL